MRACFGRLPTPYGPALSGRPSRRPRCGELPAKPGLFSIESAMFMRTVMTDDTRKKNRPQRPVFNPAREALRCGLVFLLSAVLLFSAANLSAGQQIRESVLAGTWYPAPPEQLRAQLQRLLKAAETFSPAGRLVGMVVPHAGIGYSGQVAAPAYKLLQGRRFETVVIIAPSHHVRFEGVSVYDRGGYRTPLGVIPLDTELIAAIRSADSDVRYVPEAHRKEHALEIQLPFVQLTAPRTKLVPLVMGEQSLAACRRLAHTLAQCIENRPVLLIASSDLSHFHPDETAKRMDAQAARHLRHMDAEELARDLAGGTCEACGGGPVMTVILAARRLGATQSQILDMANSGDVTGDRSRVVGYLSAALWARDDTAADRRSGPPAPDAPGGLTAQEKSLLRQIARQSVDAHLAGRPVTLPEKLSARLKTPRGAFVTLRKHGALRGCIGHVIGHYPLAETVAKMAVAAATRDPRFPGVRPDELPAITYEISVMSPLQPVSDIADIRVGTHGLYLQQGRRAGLLLPQVAVEYGWDRRTFLEQCCRKANLPKAAWKDPATRIFIFSAEVF